MADIIDQANDVADQMLEAQRSYRKPRGLLPCGTCHSCNEFLPKVGQLYCNAECREDGEYEERLRRQAGQTP